MQRDVRALTGNHFDLLIVGAGIYGAWAAWDATLRGLSVALVDQGDFGAATSANSLKIMHGGLRYLQQADFARMRESIRERAALARVAPHLLRPLPVLVPTQRNPLRNRNAFRLAFRLTELVGFDQNRGVPAELAIPRGRTVNADEYARLSLASATDDVGGGALWQDYQLEDSARLPLSLVSGASAAGACVANYVRVDHLLVHNGAVCGARARDMMSGKELEIRANTVLNCAGPWTAAVAGSAERMPRQSASPRFALALNLVTRHRPLSTAIAVQAKNTAARDPVCGGGRFLFITPWRDSTLLGTAYHICGEGATEAEVHEEHVVAFVHECNQACPELELTPDDVTLVHRGLLPLKGGREPGRPTALASRARVIDHEQQNGIAGLISVEGTKYTTARGVAERAIDLVFHKWGRKAPPCRTADTPVDRQPLTVPAENGVSLLHRQAVHAIRTEMAVKLTDVVFRRTALGSERCPPRQQLLALAEICGAELGWSPERRESEVAAVLSTYHPCLPSNL